MNKKKYLIIFAVFFFGLIGVVAKYYLDVDKKFLYDANDFYFESNLLYANTNQKSYSYKKGIDYIEFTLSNNIDDLRYSEVKINYVVTITDLDGFAVKNKNGEEIKPIEGTLSKGSIEMDTIKFENLKSGTYLVTATSTKPYRKQIQANFILTENDENIEYVVSDAKDSPILNLTVSTKDYDGNIVISWPNGVAPDSTDSYFMNVDTGYSAGSVVIPFKANSEYIFRFFKSDALTIYDEKDFSVGGES